MGHTHSNPKSHHHRDDLAGEHPFGDAGQLIAAVLFAAVWIADSFFLNVTTFLNQVIPLSVRIPIGLVLLLLAGYLAIKSMAIVFGEVREEPDVIRKSIFRFIRHPMYMSEILLYLGLLFMSVSLVGVGVWIIAILFLDFIARNEEKLLLGRFGKNYEQYMREVPRWIPRPWKQK